MSAKLYLITVPAEQRDAANEVAAQLDPQGGSLTFCPPFLCVVGAADQSVATHTGCFGPIEDDKAGLVQAAIAAEFPGAAMIQNDDAQTALAQAGLARVIVDMPSP